MNKRQGPTSIPQDHAGADADDDDRELVARCQRGDRNAFRLLFVRYHRRAFGLALGVVHNPDTAQDVVQEAFLKTMPGLENVRIVRPVWSPRPDG